MFPMDTIVDAGARCRFLKCAPSSVAIVTGAAGAIGGAVAEQLLRNGASVCICDIGGEAQIMGGEMRDGAAALEQRHDELAAATGGDVMCAVCDVTNLKQIDAMMREVESRHGRLDILANVAGVRPTACPSAQSSVRAVCS